MSWYSATIQYRRRNRRGAALKEGPFSRRGSRRDDDLYSPIPRSAGQARSIKHDNALVRGGPRLHSVKAGATRHSALWGCTLL